MHKQKKPMAFKKKGEDLKQIDSFVTDGYAFSEKTERLF